MVKDKRDIKLNVPVLARIEGEGALDLTIRKNQIEDLKLRIFEPPRLFEKLLEGRRYNEVPDIVSRICGICPVAYQMSAIHAIETLFGVEPGAWVRNMRRVYYCGEWIESHSLHIHLLAAPDFFGYQSAPAMAADYPDEVRRGLRLQALGNDIIKLFGARSVNPVGAQIGGFSHAPAKQEVQAILVRLKQALVDAEALLVWIASINFPDSQQDFTSVSLRHQDEYPMNEGRLVSSQDLDISIDDYEDYFSETQQPHSTALHSNLLGKPYLVGPLARVNLNFDKLHNNVKKILKQTKQHFPSQNMYLSMTARAAEIYYAVIEAIELLNDYSVPESSLVNVSPKQGVAVGCTEAPRGSLWHKYKINRHGVIQGAKIVPPTSQNQTRMEEDLRLALQDIGLDAPEQALRLRAEQVIRNYDPCISCATHFLKLSIQQK